MNYVRKLGFEETPDYDFLRELFSKVLKTLGEPEDGVFDWMLLNGGKGWEAGNVRVSDMMLMASMLTPQSRRLRLFSRRLMRTRLRHRHHTAIANTDGIGIGTTAGQDK